MHGRAQRSAAALCAAVFFCACAAAQSSWGEAEMRASRVVHYAPGALPDAPAFAADPLNLFIVVESGDDHVTILDGERLEPIHRFASRPALQGEPQFSPDGRYVFFASREGWIAKFDLWNLKTVVEVRAGSDTRSLAVSSDGRFVAAGNAVPATLVVLDADLQPVKLLAATDAAKRRTSPVSRVRSAAARRSFVAALPDLGEIWEVSYDPAAPEIAQGLVHDYKLREGSFVPGFLNPRRTPLDEAIDDFRLLPDGRRLAGVARRGDRVEVVHLDVRRRVSSLDRGSFEAIGRQNPETLARLQAASGTALADVSFDRHGRHALASLPETADTLIIYDTSTLREVKRLSMRKVMGKYNVFNEIKRHLGNHSP
ncbi:MAG: cytochrome C oxidase Cbb3 [Betaproteobacteria bacterium]|nr:MAG: cytochrome C oxidase Cbb3 [Betaproteobacteria bacterium]